MHTGTEKGDQGRISALLSRQITLPHTGLTAYHSNDLIFCQLDTVTDRRICNNPGNSTRIAAPALPSDLAVTHEPARSQRRPPAIRSFDSSTPQARPPDVSGPGFLFPVPIRQPPSLADSFPDDYACVRSV